jgi:hypothetical protein
MNVDIKVWDRKKGGWVSDELEELGLEFNLMYCDMSGVAIQDDGSTILLDECGRFAYLDPVRFETQITFKLGGG